MDNPDQPPMTNPIAKNSDYTDSAFQQFQRHRNARPPLLPPNYVSISKRMTVHLVETYKQINPAFSYSPEFNPRRLLTVPGDPLPDPSTYPYDNQEHNYILHVHDEIVGLKKSYIVLDSLGTGSFGQVVKCVEKGTTNLVALKVIKNLPVYYNQGMVEVNILEMLNETFNPDKYPLVRLLDNFVFRSHLCFVFELLGVSLFDLIKMNKFQGISLKLVRIFTKQILVALEALHSLGIIHCDLKPENILLEDGQTPALKIIDFGSACFENQTVYSYIQSRFYRAPEVLLGLPYSSSIDIWSLGCLCFELFAGLPLFPGQSQHRMLMRIDKCIGMPPSYMLDLAEHSQKYYNHSHMTGQWALKSDEQFATEQRLSSIPQYRQYFKHDSFESIISHYSYRSASLHEREIEERERRAFIHILKCMLRWDPDFRWNPSQLLKHPFITGQPLTDHFLENTTDAKLGFEAKLRNRLAGRIWTASGVTAPRRTSSSSNETIQRPVTRSSSDSIQRAGNDSIMYRKRLTNSNDNNYIYRHERRTSNDFNRLNEPPHSPQRSVNNPDASPRHYRQNSDASPRHRRQSGSDFNRLNEPPHNQQRAINLDASPQQSPQRSSNANAHVNDSIHQRNQNGNGTTSHHSQNQKAPYYPKQVLKSDKL